MKVRLQVIKVFDVEVDAADADEAISKVYRMQTKEIEATGKLIDVMTDHAETEEEIEESMSLIASRRKAT
jgi:K+/H+ antiporter YhaU regulatory subunit KhtT